MHIPAAPGFAHVGAQCDGHSLCRGHLYGGLDPSLDRREAIEGDGEERVLDGAGIGSGAVVCSCRHRGYGVDNRHAGHGCHGHRSGGGRHGGRRDKHCHDRGDESRLQLEESVDEPYRLTATKNFGEIGCDQ